ncbi:AAA family ATPase [Propionibacterium acidifaciens]|uniref:AAA family ATPase n=1 Tax=Propionibacterium acidifaciens TaxID=556499 RepID=UPI003670DE43
MEQVFVTRASQQVAILEGRRAVGKSSLARHLAGEGIHASCRSLTEPDVRRSAEADPDRWIRTLELPAVIDEAQLVPGVSLAAKGLVDELPQGHHLLLTGSASVGRGTMAGSDPLTGRSVRIRLDPFAAMELNAHPDRAVPSIVDVLFDAEFCDASVGADERADLCIMLRTGGIPSHCLPAVRLTRSALSMPGWRLTIRRSSVNRCCRANVSTPASPCASSTRCCASPPVGSTAPGWRGNSA